MAEENVDYSAFTPEQKVARILRIKETHPGNIMAKCFDQEYYASLDDETKLRFLKCLDSGTANPDSSMGCYANQPSDYEEFKPFFSKALGEYHGVDLSTTKHVNDWSLEGIEGLPESGVLDLAELGIGALSMRVRTARNLKKYPLPGSMTLEDRTNMEKELGAVFDQLIANPEFGGRYVSITPGHPNCVSSEEYDQLVNDHIMFKDMSADKYLLVAGIASDWPSGRGCYISEDRGFVIWVGEEDHLRIMAMQKGTILNAVFDRLKAAIDVVEKMIPGGCAYSPDYGVVTSCPTNIGTGMRASVHIPLPGLTADGTDARAKEVASPLGLSVRGLGGEHTPIGADGTVDISPRARFCISEAQIVTALYVGISKLWEQEKAAAADMPASGVDSSASPVVLPLPARVADAVNNGNARDLALCLSESASEVVELVNAEQLLHRAYLLGKTDVVDVLMATEGVQLSIVDGKKRSLLHCALDGPSTQRKDLVMKVLRSMDAGNADNVQAVINSRDSLQRSCVDLAARDTGGGRLLGKLLFLKGNPDVVDDSDAASNQKSPLALAAMAGLPQHVLALCVAKANVNRECLDEANGTSTPLIYAAMEGHHKVVKILLSAGADPSSVDRANGNTARQWASIMQHDACERLLAEVEEAAERQAQLAAGEALDDPYNLFANDGQTAAQLSQSAARVSKELVSLEALEVRKRVIEAQNKSFCASKENQFKPLMQCFLRNVLKDRPEDVLQYAAKFFTRDDLPQAVRASRATNP